MNKGKKNFPSCLAKSEEALTVLEELNLRLVHGENSTLQAVSTEQLPQFSKRFSEEGYQR
jgi:hypothetical protein